MLSANDIATVVGLCAGACTTLSFLPQVRKVLRTRKTRDLSLWAYILLACGLLLWVIYGVLVKAVAIILPNTIVEIMCLWIIRMKIKYG